MQQDKVKAPNEIIDTSFIDSSLFRNRGKDFWGGAKR